MDLLIELATVENRREVACRAGLGGIQVEATFVELTIYIYMYIYMYVYMYIYVYICVYIYIMYKYIMYKYSI